MTFMSRQQHSISSYPRSAQLPRSFNERVSPFGMSDAWNQEASGPPKRSVACVDSDTLLNKSAGDGPGGSTSWTAPPRTGGIAAFRVRGAINARCGRHQGPSNSQKETGHGNDHPQFPTDGEDAANAPKKAPASPETGTGKSRRAGRKGAPVACSSGLRVRRSALAKGPPALNTTRRDVVPPRQCRPQLQAWSAYNRSLASSGNGLGQREHIERAARPAVARRSGLRRVNGHCGVVRRRA